MPAGIGRRATRQRPAGGQRGTGGRRCPGGRRGAGGLRGRGRPAAHLSRRRGGGMNRDAVVQGVYESELPRVAAAVAIVWQLTLLLQVFAYRDDFRQPFVPVAVWLGMLAAAAWLVPRSRAGGLTGPQAAVAVAVAAAAVLLVGSERLRHGATGSV